MTTDVQTVPRASQPQRSKSLRRWGPPALRGWTTGDAIFRKACAAIGASIVGLLGLLVYELLRGSRESIDKFGLRFVVDRIWDPVAERFGASTFVYGTVVTSIIALLLAVPLGIGIAIFLVEIAPRKLAAPVGFLIELLAAIPSIVYGLWGLFVLAPIVRDDVAPVLRKTLGFLPFFRGESHGVGMLTAGIILAVMILPFIAAVSRDVLAAVPTTQREASLALGATKWETIRNVVLPYGRAGIAGAVVLALGRALGETMAVTMVIGNAPEISASLFAPGYSLPAVIANEFAEASDAMHVGALAGLALVLFGVALVLNSAARLLVRLVARGPRAVA